MKSASVTAVVVVGVHLSASLTPAAAGTFLLPRGKDVRRLRILRRYEIPVVTGSKNVAGIPALMSFWGATNEQIVLKSDFTYSVKPDKIEITADNRGMPRRYYELTWNAPDADKITVTQKLLVQLLCRNTLVTAAKLPYPKEVQERYAALLSPTAGVNSENPKVVEIGKAILKKARYAEDAVELACDWVDDHIKFKLGSPQESDTVLSSGLGSCSGMSNLGCAILRSIGIPAEPVSGTFLRGSGHAYVEAYFPDAGWVFYDCSNAARGFKSLDCLATTGWAYRVRNANGKKWHEGLFLEAEDAVPYQEDNRLVPPRIRPGPRTKNVQGVRVIHRKPPATLRVRPWPLSQLILDLSIPPGQRQYVNPSAKTATKAPAPKRPKTPATAPAPRKTATPRPPVKPPTAENPATKQLRVARMYLNGGLTAKAELMLRRIVRTYPKSKEAAEAKQLLAGISKSK